jgi:hypothetical protein
MISEMLVTIKMTMKRVTMIMMISVKYLWRVWLLFEFLLVLSCHFV